MIKSLKHNMLNILNSKTNIYILFKKYMTEYYYDPEMIPKHQRFPTTGFWLVVTSYNNQARNRVIRNFINWALGNSKYVDIPPIPSRASITLSYNLSFTYESCSLPHSWCNMSSEIIISAKKLKIDMNSNLNSLIHINEFLNYWEKTGLYNMNQYFFKNLAKLSRIKAKSL